MRSRLRWLPLVAFVVLPAVASAGPKPKKGASSTTKTQPLPSADVTKKKVPKNDPSTPVQLDPAAARALRKGKPLPKGAAVEVARGAGLDVEANDVKNPVTLTPRSPYYNPHTRLEAHGRIAYDTGIGTTGAITMPAENIRVSDRVQGQLSEEELRRAFDPYHPDFTGTAVIEDNYLVVQFRAARSTAYVVSCNVTGREIFGAVVETNGTYDSWHPMGIDGGRVSFAIPAKPGRPVVRVRLTAAGVGTGALGLESLARAFGNWGAGPWSVSRCQIIPMED